MLRFTIGIEMLGRLPVGVHKHLSEDVHTQYVIRAERKLMKMGCKIYSYDDLPKEVKDRLSGSPDICAEKNGEWVFVEVSVTRPSCGKIP